MGPNPKFIFQGLILLGGVVILAVTAVILKVRSGKSVKEILSDHKLQQLSLASAFVLFIVVCLAFILINN
jgi:hypothetical protein